MMRVKKTITTVTIVNQLISILFSGKGQKKQACVHRVCTWKNPGGKKGGGAGRGGTPKTPKTPGTPGKYRDVAVYSRDLKPVFKWSKVHR